MQIEIGEPIRDRLAFEMKVWMGMTMPYQLNQRAGDIPGDNCGFGEVDICL